MRILVVTAAAALALGACGQGGSDSATGPGQRGPGGFPNMAGTSYRLEATVYDNDGRSVPIVMIRDGVRQRMEFSTPEGESALISNAETGETLILIRAEGQTMAMRADASGMTQGFEDPTAAWRAGIGETAAASGPCTGAGETGTEWTRTDDGVSNSACVTSDGVILSAAEDGRTVWETTSVQRGPQPASAFELPPGVEVMDLNNLGSMMRGLEKARGN